LRTPREVEALIARMDVVITTRLHRTVPALKNGVPAVAINSVSGGAKIKRQAEALGSPAALEETV
jgi:polysaccharide pyruvyl transferase WcaK-like protein